MVVKDLHGYTVSEAMMAIERIVGRARANGKTEEYEFITGHGAIQYAIQDILKTYSLSPKRKLGNSGVVWVIIE